MTVYRIKGWKENFETVESKRTKHLQWVAVPNKHDGKSYRRLTRHPRAAEVFAAWNLMLQVASKASVRGELVDEDGPLDAEALSDKTGFPISIFVIAFEVLTDRHIGWLEVNSTGTPVQSTGTPVLQDRTGQDRTGHHITSHDPAARKSDHEIHRTPEESETAGADPGQVTETDETLLHLVRSRIRWQVKDPDVQAQHQASILAWLRSPDRKLVLDTAQSEYQARRSAIPWWELKEILEANAVPSTEVANTLVGWPLDVMIKSYPIIGDAVKLVEAHGWEWARDLWRYTPQQMPDHRAAMEILRTDVTASEELVRKAKASA